MNNLYVIKGTSGTGKGTRVCQLIEFLKTKETPSTVQTVYNGKAKNVGLLFKKHDVLFIGVVTTSNKSGLKSWTSMDYIHSSFGGSEGAHSVLNDIKDMAGTIILEGEPMMVSHRWRPDYIEDNWNPERLCLMYFTYELDQREEYDKRITKRSGKAAGDSGWSRNQMYHNEFPKSDNEALECASMKTSVEDYSYDERLTIIGENFFNDREQAALTSEFIKWSSENPMLREVGGANPLSKTKRLW